MEALFELRIELVDQFLGLNLRQTYYYSVVAFRLRNVSVGNGPGSIRLVDEKISAIVIFLFQNGIPSNRIHISMLHRAFDVIRGLYLTD